MGPFLRVSSNGPRPDAKARADGADSPVWPVLSVSTAVRYGRTDLTMQMILSTVGAAYGTAKAGIGIAGLGTFRSATIRIAC